MRGFRPLLLLATAAVAIAPACSRSATPSATAAATGGVHPVPAILRLPEPVAPRISGGSPTERALLHRIVAGLRPTQIRALRVLPLAAPWKGRPGDVELSVSLISGARENTLGQWETWIIGGAFHDRSAQLGLPPVHAVIDAQSGSVEANAPRPVPAPSGLAAFRARILAAVTRSGARLIGLRAGQPDGYAAEVWIAVADPVRFLQHELMPLDAALAGKDIDGVYLSASETNGRKLFISGSSSRMGAGLGGVDDPRYWGCYQFGMGGAITLVPPLPCPSNRRPPLSTPPTRPRLTGWESALSGATAGIEFVLQNPNGRPITITSIEPRVPPGAPFRLIGVWIQVPENRSDGTAAELQRPYGPEPPLKPVTIGPGNWIGVALHFRITGCLDDRGSPQNHPLSVGYVLDGVAHRATFAGLPLVSRCPG